MLFLKMFQTELMKVTLKKKSDFSFWLTDVAFLRSGSLQVQRLAICMKRRPVPCRDEDRVRNSKASFVRGLRSSKTSLKTKD